MSIRYPDLAALFLRISFGFLMAFGHGYYKVLHFFEAEEIQFISVMGLSEKTSLALAAWAEFFCSIMIIIGYKTRLFCIPLILTMAIAMLTVHYNEPFFMHSASGGSKELAFIFMSAFLTIYLLGSGKYSVDDRIDSVLN